MRASNGEEVAVWRRRVQPTTNEGSYFLCMYGRHLPLVCAVEEAGGSVYCVSVWMWTVETSPRRWCYSGQRRLVGVPIRLIDV